MRIEQRQFGVVLITLFLQRQYLCGKIKIFQENARVSAISETQFKRSLLECSISYENDNNSLSFNYNKVTKMCELSNNYPEESTVSFAGSNVYAHIVDGGWTSWLGWGSCSVTCKDGTRSRSRSCSNPSPSNGGQTCQGSSIEYSACNERYFCFLASNYIIGTTSLTQPEAKAYCESMSTRLVILESQEEIDFLATLVSGFGHWIGITCYSVTNCVWFDGRDVDSGFTAWAPDEPKGLSCISIGYYVNKWDDVHCTGKLPALCEYT